jgi:hypothetical protein
MIYNISIKTKGGKKKVKNYYTGGTEYYIIFSKGNHQLRKVTNENTGDYEVIMTAHFQNCEAAMKSIIESNYEYDHNI